MNQKTLRKIADLLNEGALNYTVFLQRYSTRAKAGTSSVQLIRAMLGDDAVVRQIQRVTTQEVLTDMEAALAYAGDSGAGPVQGVIQSECFKRMLSVLLTEAKATAEVATSLEQFWLEEGHPAYPVFWGFAFLFTGLKEAIILIGSSSD